MDLRFDHNNEANRTTVYIYTGKRAGEKNDTLQITTDSRGREWMHGNGDQADTECNMGKCEDVQWNVVRQEDPSELQRKNGQSVNKGVCMCIFACAVVRASVLSTNTDYKGRHMYQRSEVSGITNLLACNVYKNL